MVPEKRPDGQPDQADHTHCFQEIRIVEEFAFDRRLFAGLTGHVIQNSPINRLYLAGSETGFPQNRPGFLRRTFRMPGAHLDVVQETRCMKHLVVVLQPFTDLPGQLIDTIGMLIAGGQASGGQIFRVLLNQLSHESTPSL